MKTGAVIVAAGMSTRMHDFKQLMQIDGMTLAERVVVNFQRADIKDIVMVTGYRAEQVEKALSHLGITFFRNEEYKTTQMFDSAKIGLSHLKDRCDRIIFCPADVPFFSDETLDALLAATGKLVFPVYHGRNGHPIRMDTDLIPQILEYDGNRGLKGALDSLDTEPVSLYVDDEGSITDADTKEDYNHLVKIHNARLMRSK